MAVTAAWWLLARSSKAARRSAGASASASARSAKRRACGEREAPAGGLAGLDEGADGGGAQRVALRALGPRECGVGGPGRGLVVVGEQVDELVAAVAGERLEPGGDGGVHPAARARGIER